MTRKYFRSSIQELEALYKSQNDDLGLLCSLQEELTHRKTARAIKLRNQIAERLTALKTETLSQDPFTHHEPSHHAQSASRSPEEPPSHYLKPAPAKLHTKVELPKSEAGPGPPSPLPPITNRPDEILSAWTALEVLSPSNFVRPEELASGDRTRVAKLNGSLLPWERGERSRPKQRLYYQVVLGSIKMQPAVEQLIERYGDTRPEKPRVRGKAALAIVVVNNQGQLVESPAVGISSFGWGAISALNGELADLGRWPEVEAQLTERIETLLLGDTLGNNDGGEPRNHPLTREGLLAAYRTFLDELGLPREWVEPPEFAIRSYTYFMDPNPPEPLLLNSFFLADLALARKLFAEGKATHNLRRYLGVERPQNYRDLLCDNAALEEAVSPGLRAHAFIN